MNEEKTQGISTEAKAKKGNSNNKNSRETELPDLRAGYG
jgi:hypothetical protein